MSNIVAEISKIVGDGRMLTGDAVAERATSYWNSAPTQAAAIVLPGSTGDVSAILKCCHEHEQTVVTHGGLTNCVAAAESAADDIVISLEKMNRIVEIDKVGGTAVVEAGAILQDVQEAVAEQGLRFPLDLGARGSCTIGGNVATNAGGMNVLRYGMIRNLVLGLEAVLADGTVVSSMNRMMKNNAGYDVKQLFIGTEGTLGIVTRVVLRLFPRPTSQQSALVAMESFTSVATFLSRLQQQLADSLSAFEIMCGDYYAAVTADGQHRAPLSRDYPFYVVFESEGTDPDADAIRFENILEQTLGDGLIVDAVIPKSDAENRDIWNIREEFDAILEFEPVYLYDISLPIRDIANYLGKVKANVTKRWPDGRCYTIGHVADGNLHLFVAPHESGDFHRESDEYVYEPLVEVGGSVSAEHGIGTKKMKWLSHSRSAAEIELMRCLKRTLDPRNLLNRGRVIGDPM